MATDEPTRDALERRKLQEDINVAILTQEQIRIEMDEARQRMDVQRAQNRRETIRLVLYALITAAAVFAAGGTVGGVIVNYLKEQPAAAVDAD